VDQTQVRDGGRRAAVIHLSWVPTRRRPPVGAPPSGCWSG